MAKVSGKTTDSVSSMEMDKLLEKARQYILGAKNVCNVFNEKFLKMVPMPTFVDGQRHLKDLQSLIDSLTLLLTVVIDEHADALKLVMMHREYQSKTNILLA